jgi:hypothetical protein
MVVHHPVNSEITNGSRSFRMRAVFLLNQNLRRAASSGDAPEWMAGWLRRRVVRGFRQQIHGPVDLFSAGRPAD